MEKSIQIFTYNENSIEFDITSKTVMVNATEMAKPFKAQVTVFLNNADTKNFILECLKSENSHFLGIENEIDLVNSKQKSGTWMHRVLALKFAAWLNPAFELWVYRTIDELLFGAYRALEESLKDSAARKNRIEELRQNLQESDTYRELERLELEERQAKYSRGKGIKNQLDMFKELQE